MKTLKIVTSLLALLLLLSCNNQSLVNSTSELKESSKVSRTIVDHSDFGTNFSINNYSVSDYKILSLGSVTYDTKTIDTWCVYFYGKELYSSSSFVNSIQVYLLTGNKDKWINLINNNKNEYLSENYIYNKYAEKAYAESIILHLSDDTNTNYSVPLNTPWLPTLGGKIQSNYTYKAKISGNIIKNYTVDDITFDGDVFFANIEVNKANSFSDSKLLASSNFPIKVDSTGVFLDQKTTLIEGGQAKVFNYTATDVSSDFLLSFNARIKHPILAGFTPLLKIKVNGHILKRTDLVNKSQVRNYPDNGSKYHFTLRKNGGVYNWYDDSSNAWNIFYANDMYTNNITSAKYGVIGGETTSYEFEIKKYLIENSLNKIELIHNNSVHNPIIIQKPQVWQSITKPVDVTLNPNAQKDIAFTINNSTKDKDHIIRLFSRLIFSQLGGFNYSQEVRIDNTYLLNKNSIANKPQVAYGYPYLNGKYKLFSRGVGDLALFNGSSFLVPYSHDFTSNNLSGYKYGVAGGEAYKWDLLVPKEYQFPGTHLVNVKNTNSGGYNLDVRGLVLYEVTPLK